LAICSLLLVSTARLVRDSGRVLMNAVPYGVDSADVGDALQEIDGVTGFHDLHVWSIGENHVALAAHVQVREMAEWPRILEDTRTMLESRFGISHCTLQAESADEACAMQDARCGAETPSRPGPPV
ncbi:MAG: cation transporter, partial [Gammaproteobacteria bacterium]